MYHPEYLANMKYAYENGHITFEEWLKNQPRRLRLAS